MNVMTEFHPYLDGKPKRMLIGSKWLEAASGRTFETRNPATGQVLANVAEGDAEDIDRAVAAARAAFNGPWSKFKPAERQRLLLRLADLVERDIEEFAALDTLDMGAAISRRAPTASARWECCASMPAWRSRCMARRSTIRCRANTCRSR
jgi:aldehyde dehydrogenase (NAD+)